MLNKLKKILLLNLERILRNWADAILKMVTIAPSVDEINTDSVNGAVVLDVPDEQEPCYSKEINHVTAENINNELVPRQIVNIANTVDLERTSQSAADVNESSVAPFRPQPSINHNDSGAATHGIVATEKNNGIQLFVNEVVRETVNVRYNKIKTQKYNYKLEKNITDKSIQYQAVSDNWHDMQKDYSQFTEVHANVDGTEAASLTLSVIKREKYNAYYADFNNEKNTFDQSDICIDKLPDKSDFTEHITEYSQHIPASIVQGKSYVVKDSISTSGMQAESGTRHWPELGGSAQIIHVDNRHSSSGNAQHWPELPLMDQVIDTEFVHEMSHADYYRELMHRRELDMEQQGKVWNA